MHMRNFVVKNDFNRSSYHRDKKNDYSRKWDLEEELSDDDGKDLGADLGRSTADGSEKDS